ncbi:DUF5675 family protein [Belliella marina]|uniref:DUF5675 family protein n=1 Tax=Belliella marina TaxID=1644146 RepID=A0ABW4VP12_9BACT
MVDGANTINSFRFWESGLSTISAFSVPADDLTGFFLERPGPNSSVAGSRLRIPEGQYSLTNHWRERYGGKYSLQNADLSGNRGGILMHRGNYPSNTDGCLLPGCAWKPNYVGGKAPYNSGYKLNELHHFIDNAGYKYVRFNIFNTIGR